MIAGGLSTKVKSVCRPVIGKAETLGKGGWSVKAVIETGLTEFSWLVYFTEYRLQCHGCKFVDVGMFILIHIL